MNSTSIRILVVDDEPQIHRFLRPVLLSAGYVVVAAQSGQEGLRLIGHQKFSLVMLDLGLPDLNGMEVLKTLRLNDAVPVIVISARNAEADKVAALDGGADDYLEKPFSVGEMLARVRVALRRQRDIGSAGLSEVLQFPGLHIDLVRRRATSQGALLSFTPREWALLEYFARNAGRILTHRQILQAIWGPAHAENAQYLRVYVGQIRQKLGEAGCLISTETGIGYRMADLAAEQE